MYLLEGLGDSSGLFSFVEIRFFEVTRVQTFKKCSKSTTTAFAPKVVGIHWDVIASYPL